MPEHHITDKLAQSSAQGRIALNFTTHQHQLPRHGKQLVGLSELHQSTCRVLGQLRVLRYCFFSFSWQRNLPAFFSISMDDELLKILYLDALLGWRRIYLGCGWLGGERAIAGFRRGGSSSIDNTCFHLFGQSRCGHR
ncbi:hypothetical protein C7C56_015215 [Massilia glaciei]|uniref:Uncharacterized protein n=1 Tax=Massilia glaciei TaxID=1524097 RepID=A0A2U2HJ17_9BURK|nr:hypothetical protein C7C56_015215 [Massilia glaciei]